MERRMRWWTSVLVAAGLMALAAGMANAQAEDFPTQVAVYVTTLADVQGQVKSKAESAPTTWTKAGTTLDEALIRATGSLPKGSQSALASLTAALPRVPKGKLEIQLKDFPVFQLPGQKPRFAFTLVVVDSARNEVNQFGDGLFIMLTFPAGTRPFMLFKDKSAPYYLDQWADHGEIENDLFKGTVVTAGGGKYLLRVSRWAPGDPCFGG